MAVVCNRGVVYSIYDKLNNSGFKVRFEFPYTSSDAFSTHSNSFLYATHVDDASSAVAIVWSGGKIVRATEVAEFFKLIMRINEDVKSVDVFVVSRRSSGTARRMTRKLKREFGCVNTMKICSNEQLLHSEFSC